jgi:hypothetical protein
LRPSDLHDEQIINILNHGSGFYTLEYEPTGPGKFEGERNPGLTRALYERSLDSSWVDDETGSTEWAYHVALMGRFLLLENDRGFVSLEEFVSEEAARRAFTTEEETYATWSGEED